MLASILRARYASALPPSLSLSNVSVSIESHFALGVSHAYFYRSVSYKSTPKTVKNKDVEKEKVKFVEKVFPVMLPGVSTTTKLPISLIRVMAVLDQKTYMELVTFMARLCKEKKILQKKPKSRVTEFQEKLESKFYLRIRDLLSTKDAEFSKLTIEQCKARIKKHFPVIYNDFAAVLKYSSRKNTNITALPALFEMARIVCNSNSLDFIWQSQTLRFFSVADVIRSLQVEDKHHLLEFVSSWINETSDVISFSPQSSIHSVESIPEYYIQNIPKKNALEKSTKASDKKIKSTNKNKSIKASDSAKAKVLAKKDLNEDALKHKKVSLEPSTVEAVLDQSAFSESWSIPVINANSMSGETTKYKIFVDNIPVSCDCEDLRQAFENFGEVTLVTINKEGLKGKQLQAEELAHQKLLKKASKISSKASTYTKVSDPFYVNPIPKSKTLLTYSDTFSPVFAFIYFKDEASLKKALESHVRLFGIVIEGRACRVYEAKERCTLFLNRIKVKFPTVSSFVGEISKMFKWELKRNFSQELNEISFPSLSITRSAFADNAFQIEFQDYQQAELAKRVLEKYAKVPPLAPPNSPVGSEKPHFGGHKLVPTPSSQYVGGLGGGSFQVDWMPQFQVMGSQRGAGRYSRGNSSYGTTRDKCVSLVEEKDTQKLTNLPKVASEFFYTYN